MKLAKGKNTNPDIPKMTLRDSRRSSKPQKFLLHMARKENHWIGRVTCLGSEEEYRFDGLEDLKRWLGHFAVNQDKDD